MGLSQSADDSSLGLTVVFILIFYQLLLLDRSAVCLWGNQVLIQSTFPGSGYLGSVRRSCTFEASANGELGGSCTVPPWEALSPYL